MTQIDSSYLRLVLDRFVWLRPEIRRDLEDELSHRAAIDSWHDDGGAVIDFDSIPNYCL